MKKMMRRLALFLALTMLCEVLPLAAFAESDVGQAAIVALQDIEAENGEAVGTGSCGDNVRWTLNTDGVMTISGTGDMTSRPSVISGSGSRNPDYTVKSVEIEQRVTSICDNAFLECRGLTSVTIANTVESIGNSAFWHCTALTGVVIPGSVKRIEANAFYECTSLKDLTLEDGIEYIGPLAFDKCAAIEELKIPDSVTKIEYAAFAALGKVSVTLPNKLERIDNVLFTECEIDSITIPVSVKSIGNSALTCNLKDIYYPGTQEQWDAIVIDGRDQIAGATLHIGESGEDKEFTFGRDTLNFLNDANYFAMEIGKNDAWKSFLYLVGRIQHKYTYTLSDEKFDQLTAGLSQRAKTYIDKWRKHTWNGSCHGMSVVTMLHYLEPSRVPLSKVDASAQEVHDLKYPREDASVMDFINYYQLMQNLPEFFEYRSDCGARYQRDAQGEVEGIARALKEGKPVLAGLSNHTILLVGVESEDDTSYRIQVNDPNYEEMTYLKLYKTEYSESGKSKNIRPKIEYKPNTEYGGYTEIFFHILPEDIKFADLRNYFGLDEDHVTTMDFNDAHVKLKRFGNFDITYGQVYVRMEDGQLVKIDGDVQVVENAADDGEAGEIELIFPKTDADFKMTIDPGENGNTDTDILLNDTLLSVATGGAATVNYKEQSRDVEVTTDKATEVNLLMTQNETDENWPWDSWGIDTADTTTFHAKLDSEGLHMEGDGIVNAQYALANGETDEVATGTITDEPDDDGIVKTLITADSGTIQKPTTPSGGGSGGAGGSGGGDGAGAILAVGAVAVAAVAVGAAVLTPVEVQGKVELADHTALPNVKISLLQNGNVVTQTTADASGHFALSAKRGSYELTAVYTDADGNMTQKTVAVKIPSKDLVVTF